MAETVIKSEPKFSGRQEKPTKSGEALGTFVLTSERVLFVSSGAGKAGMAAGLLLSGPLTHGLVFKALSEVKPADIEVALQNSGSVSIPYKSIKDVKQEGAIKSVVIDYKDREGEKTFRIQTLGSGLFGAKAFKSLQPWVDEINKQRGTA